MNWGMVKIYNLSKVTQFLIGRTKNWTVSLVVKPELLVFTWLRETAL